MSIFTYPEITFEVALNLPYRTILSLCTTNMLVQTLCNDEYFWNQKSLREYGRRLPVDLTLTPKDRYLKLLSRNNCVEGSERFIDRNLCLTRASLKNDQKLIRYFLSKGATPDITIANIAAGNGNLDLFKYYVDHTNRLSFELFLSLYPDSIKLASSNNRLNIINYILSQIPDKLKSYYIGIALEEATINNNQNLINHLRNLGITPKYENITKQLINNTLLDLPPHYNRSCSGTRFENRQPIIIFPNEIEKWSNRTFYYQEQLINRPVGEYIVGGSKQFFVCPNNDYPFPRISKGSQMDNYPYIPCCFKKPQY
jgi:hypothetical protein